MLCPLSDTGGAMPTPRHWGAMPRPLTDTGEPATPTPRRWGSRATPTPRHRVAVPRPLPNTGVAVPRPLPDTRKPCHAHSQTPSSCSCHVIAPGQQMKLLHLHREFKQMGRGGWGWRVGTQLWPVQRLRALALPRVQNTEFLAAPVLVGRPAGQSD